MRSGIVVNVTSAERRKLKAIIANGATLPKHVWRANIILATADGCGTTEIMRRTGKSKAVVWRWQARFMAEGVAGLTRDKARGSGKPPLPAATVQRVVDLASGPPIGAATRWTSRMLAKAAGVSLGSVRRIVEAHQLAPYPVRSFKRSIDPTFIGRLEDIVAFYVDPPSHAAVLSLDGGAPTQDPVGGAAGLPSRPGRDYRPRGIASLFVALDVLDGTLMGRPVQRRRHLEFIRFLNKVEALVPGHKAIHAVVDHDATHKHPKVREWLERHPRWTFHFTPAQASWRNALEELLGHSMHRRLKRRVFRSIADLRYALNGFVSEADLSPPFVWIADPRPVPAAAKRGNKTA